MTTSIEIPDDVLQRAMRLSGASSAQAAVMAALEEFVKRHDQRSIIPLLGTFDDFMTPEELDEMRSSN